MFLASAEVAAFYGAGELPLGMETVMYHDLELVLFDSLFIIWYNELQEKWQLDFDEGWESRLKLGEIRLDVGCFEGNFVSRGAIRWGPDMVEC